MHTSLSAQLIGVVPTQVPPLQTSTVVQMLWSSHGALFGAPFWQRPPLQVSPVVHTLPSSHVPPSAGEPP